MNQLEKPAVAWTIASCLSNVTWLQLDIVFTPFLIVWVCVNVVCNAQAFGGKRQRDADVDLKV